jgi:hypothetical protein
MGSLFTKISLKATNGRKYHFVSPRLLIGPEYESGAPNIYTPQCQHSFLLHALNAPPSVILAAASGRVEARPDPPLYSRGDVRLLRVLCLPFFAPTRHRWPG